MQNSPSLLVVQSLELSASREGGLVGVEVGLNLVLQVGHLGLWVRDVESFGNFHQLMFTFVAQRASEGRTATGVSAEFRPCIGMY
jgi:hypothetical protein